MSFVAASRMKAASSETFAKVSSDRTRAAARRLPMGSALDVSRERNPMVVLKRRGKMRNLATIGLAVIAMIASQSARSHDHGHHHASFSAGEPGDPRRPARTIEIAMKEMMYEPSGIEVKPGEQIRFVLHNVGSEDHEFLLATTKENLKHAKVMKKHPRMRHAEPNGVRVAPKKTAEILWKFTKVGTFEYSCLIPDHREYGMTGHVTVK
jgi:uncharacterized cupredoxin-like copper-binding protein